MRKKYCKFLSVALAAVVMATSVFPAGVGKAYASTGEEIVGVDEERSGDWFYWILDDGTVEVRGYEGNNTELVIPSQLDGYRVTGIGDYAFWFCPSFKMFYMIFNLRLYNAQLCKICFLV